MEQRLETRMKDAIHQFADKPAAFSAGELDRKTYKGLSGGMGSYAQRDPARHMLRLRMVGGCMDQDKLRFVADAVEKYQVDRLKLTTCQTLQLHDLPPQALAPLMEQALEHGIVTLGGGGDNPRSVMASPLSGVEQGEAFDVQPYAQAAADYLLGRMLDLHMPRKLKVAFSNSPKNETHATFRDLGFVAQEDGTFRVYCAGGLGPNPKLGVCVEEHAAPADVLYYIDAMIRVFTTFGNYENRAKSRTRYLQETLGVDGLRSEFAKALAQARAQQLTFALPEPEAAKQPDGEAGGERVIRQKQPGLYAVWYHPAGGNLPPEMPRKLCRALEGTDRTQVRIGPDGTLYVINLTGRQVPAVLEATEGGARTAFECSVSCIGAKVCQQGVRDSQGLLAAMMDAVRPHAFADGVLPRVRVSGCPSSCGCHQISGLGFVGGVKLIDKVAHPAFTLFAGGSDAQNSERFGEKLGVLLEEDIPAFMVRLGETVQAAGTTYDRWAAEHHDDLAALVAQFAR